MAVKSVSIRIEEEMLEKIGYVADFEGRSVNSHVLVLIRENIEAFEKKYGKIEGDIRPDISFCHFGSLLEAVIFLYCFGGTPYSRVKARKKEE